MIFEVLINIVVALLCGLVNGMSLVSLPLDLVSAVATVIRYGNYVVGADLMLITFSCIAGWIGMRCTLGLIIFIWKMLPLT